MALGKQIRRYREHRDWTLERLSSESGVAVGTISALENRDSLRSIYAAKIAAAFGVSVETLMDADPANQVLVQERPNVTQVPAMRLVPILNKVNAGMYKEIVEAHPDDIDYVPVYMPTKRYTFALRVDGDSMEPGFPHGCIVIVDPEIEAKPNDYVIAMNGDNESTFKQLIKDGPDFYLRPRNPRYPIKPLGTASIIGVVCGIQLQAKPGDPTWPV